MSAATRHRLSMGLAMALLLLDMTGCSRKESSKMESELELNKQINLGVILDTTQPLELFIPVKNRANRKITISKVAKDCACTSVTMDKLVLMPGETATLQVSTNLTGKTNLYTGYVVIESDASEKIDEIQIQGQITGQIRIRPAQTTLVMGDRYEPANFTVFCDDQTGKWKYEGFSSEDRNISVDFVEKSTSPTTSIYTGTVHVEPDARKSYGDYRMTIVTLKFANEKLKKSLELHYPIELAVRRKLTTDPAQVTFGNGVKNQKRTVIVQSGDPIDIDAANCGSPCVKSNVERVDAKTLKVELVFTPSASEELPQNLACDLQSKGKTLASIPINIVSIQ